MNKVLLIFTPILLIISGSEFTNAQVKSSKEDLYLPRNISFAYEKETRSTDGKPGRNYWQNNSEYKIEAEFDPATKSLHGKCNITYQNNSPDTLKTIVFRLYQDIFKKGAARDGAFNPDGLTDGLMIHKLIAGTQTVDTDNKSEFNRFGTNAVLELQNYLSPNSSIDLIIEWSYLISSNRLRTGEYDSTSFFIAYWYPEVAVYDDIDGWDLINYGGTQEFYNDFSSFDVRIKVPNSFCVWATGELQNPQELLTSKFLNLYEKSVISEIVVRIITKEDLKVGNIINTSSENNTWHFKALNSSAFAFGLSDHYLWDGTSTVVDSLTGRRVFVDTGYRVESEDFYDAAIMTKKIIEYFSYEFPSITFPFPVQTIFNGSKGGGGMEHPMIVNNGTSSTKTSAEALIAHEIAHQYLPFYLGTNEKKYAFMDEGWAVFFTIDYQENFSASLRLKTEVSAYQKFAGKELELPPIIPSNFITGTPYRMAAYTRPALAYYFLQDLLGKDEFKKALQELFTRWNCKHPLPYDMFYTFNEVTGENLNWYWKPWFFEHGFPDLALDKIIQDSGSVKIIIRKVGNIPVPVQLKLIFEDDSTEIIYRTANVWKEGNDLFEIIFETEKDLKEVILGSDTIPDVDSENNLIVIH